MTRRFVLLLLLVSPIVVVGGESSADELSDLKQRFKQRFKTLQTLKNAGKVGETSQGRVEAVKSAYLEETAETRAGKPVTIDNFIELENRDRRRLYALIAAQTKATAASVGVRNARRNYKKARSTHYLKQKDGTWIQKKDLSKKAP